MAKGGGGRVFDTRPVLNESIFYNYEYDNTPLKKKEFTPPQTVNEYIRENNILAKAGEMGEMFPILIAGVLMLVMVNMFRR